MKGHDMTVAEMLTERVRRANERYGPIASTHEALGVALEEWDELREALRSNNLIAIRNEAVDLAAVLMRLASACQDAHESDMATTFARRSWK